MPTTQASPGFFGNIKNAVGGFFSGVGNTISSNVSDASNALDQFNQSGSNNPIPTVARLSKDISGAVASPITQAIGMASNATGATGALNNISQGFVNSPVGQATTNLLSKAGAPALGTASDLFETAGNVTALEGANNIWEKAYSKFGSGSTGTATDTASSRVADATPAYDKSLVGDNVKTPEGKIVPRVNEGQGLTGQRTVTTSASEAQSGQELNNLKDYPDKGTALEKSQAVARGINAEAENMRGSLQAEDKANPLDTNAEKIKVSQLVRQQLPEDIQAKVGVNTPEENAMLRGMSEKAGSPIPEGGKYDLRAPDEKPSFPKTAAGSYYSKVLDALNKYDGTREGKLNLRQATDAAYESARGKLAWGSDSQNALDEVNTGIRNSLNKDLADTSKNTDTQASLQKQTNLYRAKDVLNNKAQAEAASTLGRFFQQHPILHRLATREFMRTATSIGSTAVGVPLLIKLITDTLKGK
jgi:hypothetical protein